MKRICSAAFSFVLATLLLTACSSGKKMPVAGKNTDLGTNFGALKTYNWTADIDNIPDDKIYIGANGVYVFNNESGRKMIKDAIRYELDSRGYQMTTINPDMLVSFSVLEQPATLRSTEGYVTVSSGEKVRTEDNVSYTDVAPGTLIVNMVDAEKHTQVWQGFVSGILKPNLMADQAKVRQAVSTVFNQYQYEAKR